MFEETAKFIRHHMGTRKLSRGEHRTKVFLEIYTSRLSLPEPAPCVYLLFAGTVLEYVGCTINVRRRLGSHPHYQKDRHTIGVVQCSKLYWYHSILERELIERFKPPLNVIGTPRMVEMIRLREEKIGDKRRRKYYPTPAIGVKS